MAALRELFEETGQRFADAGEPVWFYDFEVSWDQADHDRGHAEYFWVRAERFEPSNEFWTPEEHHDVSDWGWFTAEEIRRSATPYEPEFLPDLVSRLSVEL